MSQRLHFDVVVVGSGPAGASTARHAAQKGLNVLLVDKKQELGAPIQCSGAVSAHALQDAGVPPDAEFVLTAIYGFIVYDEDGSPTRMDYRKINPEHYRKAPLGYVVDRRRFDRFLMTGAERAGVTNWLKTEAIGFKSISGQEVELTLNRLGEELQVRTRVIVAADGLQSQVGKWAGLSTNIRLSELASCLQYIVDGVDCEALLEIVTGHQWAPGGYAWVFPKDAGYAEVGLGVIRSITDKDARWHLQNFIDHSFMKERFRDLRILEIQGGGVPLASPLKKQYADNMILVGDAARHVNPITGGGIHTALRCGVIAGNFLGDLLAAGKTPSADNLAAYQTAWEEEMGESMWQLYRHKRQIFRNRDLLERNRMLHSTLSRYFSPESEYRKI